MNAAKHMKTSPAQRAAWRRWADTHKDAAQANRNAWSKSPAGKLWRVKTQKKRNRARARWRKRRRAAGFRNDAGTNLERVEMTMHTGTHIDALGHFSSGDFLFNGFCAPEVVTDWGLTKLGIENAPPIITRGLIFDVAGLDGNEHLNPGRVVTPDDLARCAHKAAFTVEPGDVALIRTGWSR